MEYSLIEARPGKTIVLLPNAPTFTVVAVSREVEEATGRLKEKFVGQGFFSLLNNSEPLVADQQTIRASFELVLQEKRPHRIADLQYAFRTGDGLLREADCTIENVPVLSDEGEVRYLIHTIEEDNSTSSLQRRENPFKDRTRAHSLFMQAPVAVCIVKGPLYIVELVNEQMLQLLGRTPAMIGRPIVESLPEAKLQGLMTILETVRSSGKGYHAPNFPASLVIDGVREQRYFDLVFEPYFNPSSDAVPDSVFCVAYNVTGQIKVQQRLEEVQLETEKQKRLYEAITASTPDLMYVFDLSYQFIYANEALLKMWGKEWNEAIGKGLLENGYEPWHAEMHERQIDEVVANKQPIRGEVSFPHATMGNRVYDYIFVPVLNKEGEVEAVAGTTRDITEIKQAEQTVREREESFRKLADDSPMFVFMIEANPQATVSYWNKTWLLYTGQPLEQATGRAWDRIIHPEDVPVVMAHYTPSFESRQPYLIPAVRVKRSDGVYRWHAFKGNPRYLPGGEFNGYVGVGFDVHEQKLAQDALIQNEARTRLAVESTRLGTFEVDVVQQTIRHSPRTAEIMGLDPSRQWSYQTIIDTVHPEDRRIRLLAHEEARRSGKLFYEARIIHPDQSIRWVRLNGAMIDFLGSSTMVGTIMDMTDEKKAAELLEQKIEERTRELKQVNDQLKQFSYAASHDLQEPLRKISYFVERLSMNLGQTLNEENKMITERIRLTTGRMRTLIDDLLEYSNTTLGTAVFEDVDLSAIVHSVLDDMEATLLEKKAEVSVEPLSSVKGDYRQLRQLFQNLISNALKYHKNGEAPQLQINSRFVQGNEIESDVPETIPDKRFYQVRVTDNGIGFDPDDAERIFRIFQRLHGKAEFEGTGVGLAIVERVVKNHHGYIWAVSSPGAGATFTVLLPAE